MGQGACKIALKMVKQKVDTILDPFCGQGSILLEAQKAILNMIGIDILKE